MSHVSTANRCRSEIRLLLHHDLNLSFLFPPPDLASDEAFASETFPFRFQPKHEPFIPNILALERFSEQCAQGSSLTRPRRPGLRALSSQIDSLMQSCGEISLAGTSGGPGLIGVATRDSRPAGTELPPVGALFPLLINYQITTTLTIHSSALASRDCAAAEEGRRDASLKFPSSLCEIRGN